MSDYYSYSGKLEKLRKLERETIEDACKRMGEQEKGLEKPDYCDTWEEYMVGEEMIIISGDNLYRVIEKKDLGDEDMFARLTPNKDGTISFHTRYYDGGTCFSEMIEDALNELNKET